jgi:hypothetical protein
MIDQAYILYKGEWLGRAEVKERMLLTVGKGPTVFECYPVLLPAPGTGYVHTAWCFLENNDDLLRWMDVAAEVYTMWLAVYVWCVGRG